MANGLETAPPTIALTNSNSPSSAPGSKRILTTPNCSAPPDCFLCLPSASTLPLMVSLNAILGSPKTASAPNLLFNFLHKISN